MPRVISVVESASWGRGVIMDPDKSEVNVYAAMKLPTEPSLRKIMEEQDEERNISTVLTEDTSDKTEYSTLPYMQSSLFGTILEDAATQLRILVECNNELRITKTKSDWNRLMLIKYDVKQPTSDDVLEGIDPKNLGCNEYKINKLDGDRKFITDVITQTYVDLSLDRTFKNIKDHSAKITHRDNYLLELIEEEAKNKTLRHELYRQLRQQRNHIKSAIYDTELKIDQLKTQVEDSVLLAECQNRYISNWQNARTEQHLQTIHDNESGYIESVRYLKQRTDHESRVHMEIEMLVNIAINETLQKVEFWMDKYDVDIEAIDLKIQIKKNAYQDMQEKRIRLEKTIELHEKEMKEWIDFKEAREKDRAYRELMTKSAITVQAWWRGLLVRLLLGPYKPKKKAGKKKDKK